MVRAADTPASLSYNMRFHEMSLLCHETTQWQLQSQCRGELNNLTSLNLYIRETHSLLVSKKLYSYPKTLRASPVTLRTSAIWSGWQSDAQTCSATSIRASAPSRSGFSLQIQAINGA